MSRLTTRVSEIKDIGRSKFKSFHHRFGAPGLVAAVGALVVMLAVTAPALGISTKQIKKLVKKEVSKQIANVTGTPGAPGGTGPAGAAGPAGPEGPEGDQGIQGVQGAAGTSVVSSTEPPGPNCTNAGSKFVAGASTTYACNGTIGADGAPGSPWTAGGTLPAGATQTGTWSFTASASDVPLLGAIPVAISFPIPLAAGLPQANTHYVLQDDPPNNPMPAECQNPDHPGGASTSNPEADPGHLCVFAPSSNAVPQFVLPDLSDFGVSPPGAVMLFEVSDDPTFGLGSWAVTG